MKRLFAFAVLGVFVLSLAGCGTAYRAAMDQRTLDEQKNDTVIEAAIKSDLIDDETVKALDMSVYSFLGKVYLVGEYETAAQRDRAKAIAAKAEGVKSVTTYLLPKKDDPDCGTSDNLGMLASVKKDLIADTEISSTNIEVKTVQCNVVLLGLVADKATLDAAVAHARAVEGVRSVKSYLRVMAK